MRKHRAVRSLVTSLAALAAGTLLVSAFEAQERPEASIDLPPQMTAEGVTYQNGLNGEPWETACNPSLETCFADSGILYDRTNGAMYTHFDPCLPLLTPDSGSAEPCQYYFTGNDVFYVFQNQPLINGVVTSETQCCVINDFSLLSPRFPAYVQQSTANGRCGTDVPIPGKFHMLGQAVTWNPTPGAGFYGFYPEVVQSNASGSWVVPNGFGGTTPDGSFTQITFHKISAGLPASVPSLPSLCQGDVPQCTTVIGEKTVSLSEFFRILKQPWAAGCELCHTTQGGDTYQGDFPCCPDGSGCPPPPWEGDAVSAEAAKMKRLLEKLSLDVEDLRQRSW